MIAPARVAAYETVLAVAAGRSDLPSALARTRSSLDDERDRALAVEIATGTLRWQGALDHVIAAYAARPFARLDAEVLAILRIGMFQLLHLDRVPASAVVDDAVAMTGKAGKRSASGLVNAILRRASRERTHLPLPPEPDRGAPPAAALDYLSTTLSHPRWLASRWLDWHGYEAAAAWTRFDNRAPALTLRANRLRVTPDMLSRELAALGVETAPTRFAPDGLTVSAGNPLLTPLAHSGLFVVQDEASQLVGTFVSATPGERLLDVCASPGGKTTQLAAIMSDTGTVVAADARGRRLDLLTRTVRESGARCIHLVQADARRAPPFLALFDAVLVDAPCSGLGTLRRDPDIRWRRVESDLAVLSATQREMVAQAALSVRPGGRLIYATCSSEPEENEEVVAAFLSGHPDFRRHRPASFADRPEIAALLDQDGALRTLPFRDGLEAFYAAALTRVR